MWMSDRGLERKKSQLPLKVLENFSEMFCILITQVSSFLIIVLSNEAVRGSWPTAILNQMEAGHGAIVLETVTQYLPSFMLLLQK